MSSIPQRIGNYILEKEIGRGATSEVWRARHAHLSQRHVAVKILMSQDKETIQRFTREANMASRLRHAGIVQIYDHGYYNNYYCTVMEYINGVSLRQLLEKQPAGRLPLDTALDIFKQIASALDYAHSLDIIHRDVAPGNVLIEEGTGRALLTDFGIARDPGQSITVANSIMGTPGFWSPEHAQSATTVTHLSDIFSLGVVLYMMLSGQLPWEETPGPLEAKFPTALPLKKRGVEKIPEDLERVLQTLLAVDPLRRFPSAQAAVDELDRIFLRHQVVTQLTKLPDTNAPPSSASRTTEVLNKPPVIYQIATDGIAENEVETYLGPDLLREPIARAHQRAADLRQPTIIAEMLDKWAASDRFHLRRAFLGRLARLHKVSSRNVYYYRLRVLYEQRDLPVDVEEPDHEAQVFPLEPEVDRWLVTLPAVKNFEDIAVTHALLPGSTRIMSCEDCKGKGAQICPVCKGKQRIYISRPITTGSMAATQTRLPETTTPGGFGYAPTTQGATATGSRTQQRGSSKEPAATVPTEQVLIACPECMGRGGITCDRCDGVGRLIKRKSFQWQRLQKLTIGNNDLPNLDEAWLKKTFESNEIYCERSINGFRPEWSLVSTLKDLVATAHTQQNENVRVVLSEVAISFIPVSDIVFDLGKPNSRSKEKGFYSLAIYGFENYIPPDWRFLNWERISFLGSTVILTILVIVFGLLLFG